MKMFDSKYIEDELKKINSHFSDEVKMYIIGGGAMSFYDIKAATKDIDVIVETEKEAKNLINALYKSGYKKIEPEDPVYQKMRTREIIENKDGFRWDIFVNVVCGGLSFSKDMKKRAITFKSFSKIKVFLVSSEDIFIFKSVTSRPRDREDMFALFSSGIDADIIKEEIKQQAMLDENKAWISYFFIGLDELVSDYDIVFPGYKEFLKLAEEDMMEKLMIEFVRRKPLSLDDLAFKLKSDKKEIRAILDRLINQDKIKKLDETYYTMN